MTVHLSLMLTVAHKKAPRRSRQEKRRNEEDPLYRPPQEVVQARLPKKPCVGRAFGAMQAASKGLRDGKMECDGMRSDMV